MRANPDYAPQAGFAFTPHNRDTVEGEATYGDTSMTTEFLARTYPDWKIVRTDWSMVDTYQRYVFLQPA